MLNPTKSGREQVAPRQDVRSTLKVAPRAACLMRGILVKATKQVEVRALHPRLAIVKLGGSHAAGPHLKDWLTAIATEAGSIVIVPGGGPFADTVRAAQAGIGFDDRAAHTMALMAMAQFGSALVSLNPALQLAASRSAIWRALKDGKVP